MGLSPLVLLSLLHITTLRQHFPSWYCHLWQCLKSPLWHSDGWRAPQGVYLHVMTGYLASIYRVPFSVGVSGDGPDMLGCQINLCLVAVWCPYNSSQKHCTHACGASSYTLPKTAHWVDHLLLWVHISFAQCQIPPICQIIFIACHLPYAMHRAAVPSFKEKGSTPPAAVDILSRKYHFWPDALAVSSLT